ncbi:MAG: hypothetical protein A2V86_17895 [Deltaproteobacteria bacterium RBG_16_49_23]|nr:MAG: hypothetical protein A2V86_17895 [Deltaproteobacteria bacterium RBG_16_49_23]
MLLFMDKKDLAMDTRKAIFDFQYSEKMKSGLIIGTNLLEQLVALKGEGELSGGRKVLTWYLEGLLRELRIAQNVIGMDHYVNLERKMMEIVGRVQMSQFQEALRSFSEAISLATTSCQTSMSFLMEKKLL